MTRKFLIPATIFITVFTIYIFFPSNQYCAVDGSLRCLDCMNAPKLFIHGNQHMLYPVNVILWTRLMSLLFTMKPQDPISFIKIVELMNSFFAAIAVTSFYFILKNVTSKTVISVVGASLLAFSNAFIVNAVNSNEPMVGFAISVLAVVFTHMWLSSDKNRIFFGLLGATLLSLAMATYQSMFSIAPSMIILVGLFSIIKNGKTILALKYIPIYIIYIVISFLFIYFLSHWLINPDESFRGIRHKLFFLTDDYRIWIRIAPVKFMAIPFSLVYGFVHLDKMEDGIRAFFSEQEFNCTIISAITLYILMPIFLAALAYASFKIFNKIDVKKRVYLIVSIVALVSSLIVPLALSAVYTKLLIQPVAALIAVAAVIISESRNFSREYSGKVLKIIILIFVILSIFWNFKNVLLRMHFHTSSLQGAKELISYLEDDSLIITDWDNAVITLYKSFYKKPAQDIFCLSSEMIALKRDSKKFVDKLRKTMDDFRKRNKKIYFFNVLEKSKSKWSYFLKEKLNIDYDIFNEYRKSARFIRTFGTASLYEY